MIMLLFYTIYLEIASIMPMGFKRVKKTQIKKTHRKQLTFDAFGTRNRNRTYI